MAAGITLLKVLPYLLLWSGLDFLKKKQQLGAQERLAGKAAGAAEKQARERRTARGILLEKQKGMVKEERGRAQTERLTEALMGQIMGGMQAGQGAQEMTLAALMQGAPTPMAQVPPQPSIVDMLRR